MKDNIEMDIPPLADRDEATHAATFLNKSVVYNSRQGLAVRTPRGESYLVSSMADVTSQEI